MSIKSVAIPTRSPLFSECFDFDRLLSSHYLFSMKFEDLQILAQDFYKLSHDQHRFILYNLVNEYHKRYQRKLMCANDALYELILRIIFETLKNIITISSIRRFKKDIYKSMKRDKNHQIRIHMLLHFCKKKKRSLTFLIEKNTWIQKLLV